MHRHSLSKWARNYLLRLDDSEFNCIMIGDFMGPKRRRQLVCETLPSGTRVFTSCLLRWASIIPLISSSDNGADV